jgi:hypothetical protein
MNELEVGHKSEWENVKITSDNAIRINEQVLEKLHEINETNNRIREDMERRRPPSPLREIDLAVDNLEEDRWGLRPSFPVFGAFCRLRNSG